MFEEEGRCLRIEPSEAMNGCFMACFERIMSDQSFLHSEETGTLKKNRRSKSIPNLNKYSLSNQDPQAKKPFWSPNATRKSISTNNISKSKSISKSQTALQNNNKRVKTINMKGEWNTSMLLF